MLDFFWMIRSNLAPDNSNTFDHTNHTCRGDILFTPQLILKLTKAAPTTEESIPLLPIPGVVTEPMAAYRQLLHLVPSQGANDPLLWLPTTSGRTVLQLNNSVPDSRSYSQHSSSCSSYTQSTVGPVSRGKSGTSSS